MPAHRHVYTCAHHFFSFFFSPDATSFAQESGKEEKPTVAHMDQHFQALSFAAHLTHTCGFNM